MILPLEVTLTLQNNGQSLKKKLEIARRDILVMAPLKKLFSHDGVTHKNTILVMAPLKVHNFIRVQN